MGVLTHGIVLLGIFALLLFGPRRSGYHAGPAERTAKVLLFLLAVLAFAIS